MNTLRRILSGLALLVLCVTVASGQAIDALSETPTAVGTDKLIVQTNSAGSAGQKFTRSITLSNLLNSLTNLSGWPASSGGSATNAVSTVSTNGTAVSSAATSINFIPGTNVVLNATNTGGAVSIRINAAGVSTATGGTNIYTNALYLNAYGTAIQNGALLTNAATTAAAGTMVIVGPGSYYIPTNGASLLKDQVTLYFMDGAIVSSGAANDISSDRWLFDDFDGYLDAKVLGYGSFYHTNSSSSGALAYIQNASSTVHLEYKVARTVGQSPCIVVSAGVVTVHGRELTRSDSYDALYVLGGKVRATGSRIEGGDSIIETSSSTDWGDQVFEFAHGEALSTGTGASALNVADKVHMTFGTILINRSASIYGNLTNANNTGSGVLQAGVIFTKTNSTLSLIGPSGSDVGTAFTLKDAVVHGPWNVDAINANTMGGKLTLQNVTIYNGPNSTNWARGINSSRVAINGALTLGPVRPVSSTITLTGETNLVYSLTAASTVAAPTLHLNGGTTASRAAVINSSTNLAASTVTETELGYVSGVSSAIQTQLGNGTNYTVTASNNLYSIETTRNAAVSNAAVAFSMTASNTLYSYTDTAASNRVRLTGGTGGITVSQSGSGGVQTWTINDDDAGGGSTTNFNTLGVGSITVGTVIVSNLVRVGRIDVLTNANVGTLTVTNAATFNGVVTNSGDIYSTSTASFDGVVTLGSDLNAPSGTITGNAVVGATVAATGSLENTGRRVDNIDKIGATVSVATTAGPAYSIATNQTITLSFSGTPLHGQRLSLIVSNTATTNWSLGIPSVFSPQLRSNVTAWSVAASNYVILPYLRTTNEVGGGLWMLEPVTELQASLAVASAGANGFFAMLTNAGGNIITISNAYIPQASSMVLSNLVAGPSAITNGIIGGWGQALVTNSGVISVVATNREASIATNATSVTLDFGDTANLNRLNGWFHLTTNLVVSPTNLVVGRTMALYFNTNALTYDVTITNTAATPVRWNFNVSTNGSTSFTKTNTLRARVFLTAETNGVITAEMGYYR